MTVQQSKQITVKRTFKWSASTEAPSGTKLTATLNTHQVAIRGVSSYYGNSSYVEIEDVSALIELLEAAESAVLERKAEELVA